MFVVKSRLRLSWGFWVLRVRRVGWGCEGPWPWRERLGRGGGGEEAARRELQVAGQEWV